MLIDSPRLGDDDRRRWETVRRYLSALPPSPAKIDRAMRVIDKFRGPGCTVSTSWGKDSVAVAALAAEVDPTVSVTWVRVRHLDPPETLLVRDQFLAAHPRVEYRELIVDLPVMRGEAGFPGPDFDMFTAVDMPPRVITGVRATESKQRRMSAGVHGVATVRRCRPILHWTTMDVLALAEARGLPIHTTYALTWGGALSLDDVRVHTLGTAALYHSPFWDGLTAWEDHYYSDVLRAALDARAPR